MNQLNFISNLPHNQFAFEQESGTKKGILTLSGINTYAVEMINIISGVEESNFPLVTFDFKDKDISIGNDKHSFRIEKERSNSKYSFLQFNENKPVKIQLGTSYTDTQGNNFVDDFNLTYKTGYLNLDQRPHVNGTGVLLSGEAIANNLVYSFNSTNFIFGENYLNFANSSSNLTGILPSGIVSGINYYAKNLNSGILLITGSGQRTIDGFSTVNLYKNESLQLVGVNNPDYTGWVTISADGGIS